MIGVEHVDLLQLLEGEAVKTSPSHHLIQTASLPYFGAKSPEKRGIHRWGRGHHTHMLKRLTQDKVTGEWIILQGEDQGSLTEVLRTSDSSMAHAAYDLEHDVRLKNELSEAAKAIKTIIDRLVENYEERKGKDPEEVPAEKEEEKAEVEVDVKLREEI